MQECLCPRRHNATRHYRHRRLDARTVLCYLRGSTQTVNRLIRKGTLKAADRFPFRISPQWRGGPCCHGFKVGRSCAAIKRKETLSSIWRPDDMIASVFLPTPHDLGKVGDLMFPSASLSTVGLISDPSSLIPSNLQERSIEAIRRGDATFSCDNGSFQAATL